LLNRKLTFKLHGLIKLVIICILIAILSEHTKNNLKLLITSNNFSQIGNSGVPAGNLMNLFAYSLSSLGNCFAQ